jgi:hypothetical protein
MIDTLALVTVLVSGCYLIALGLVALLKPEHAKRFLLGFVASAYLHYFELLLRITVGLAFVVRASLMMFAEVYIVFGWVLIGTSAILCCIPWQQHQRFAQWSVPQALRRLTLIAVSSLVLGIFIIICALPSIWD